MTSQKMRAGADPGPRIGSDLLVSVQCRACGKTGWVQVEHLDRGMRCLECRAWFQIDRGGSTPLRRNPREKEFHCPRCHVSGYALLDSQDQAECISCRLPLRCGPDGRLHSLEQVAQMVQQLEKNAQLRRQQELEAKAAQPSKLPSRFVLLAATLAGCILTIAVIAWYWTGEAPQQLSSRMTRLCLAGEWERAEALVGDDEYELADFHRWRVRHFASIQDRFRPDDVVQITVAQVHQSPDQLITRVKLQSRIIGTRNVTQYWTREESGWSFDATASLNDPRKVNRAFIDRR